MFITGYKYNNNIDNTILYLLFIIIINNDLLFFLQVLIELVLLPL